MHGGDGSAHHQLVTGPALGVFAWEVLSSDESSSAGCRRTISSNEQENASSRYTTSNAHTVICLIDEPHAHDEDVAFVKRERPRVVLVGGLEGKVSADGPHILGQMEASS